MSVVWLALVSGCGWLSSSESELPSPVATASITGRPRTLPRIQAVELTEAQLTTLDDLFVRSTELVREGSPGAFSGATITFVQTGLEAFHPRKGETVTVVPAAGGLAPQVLRVSEIAEAELFVQLTTTSTTDAGWLAAPAPAGARPEMLGRATLLYPVVVEARAGAVPGDLPEGLTPSTIVAAVDISEDGVADIVTSEHCCDDPTLALSDACDGGPCLVTWVRSAKGWRVAEDI